MYWNWGLDWVISHCHITIIMVMNGVPICMGMVYWNGSYQMMHMKWSHGYGWCTPLWPDNHSCLVYTLQWSLMNPIQYPIPYHTTPRGNFVYKLGTKLSCSLSSASNKLPVTKQSTVNSFFYIVSLVWSIYLGESGLQGVDFDLTFSFESVVIYENCF